MKVVVAAFNQEKALVGAFSVITNLRMELFEALLLTVVIILTVIPYAFSSVLRQMEAVRALEAAGVKPSAFSEYSTQLTFNI